MSMPAVKDLMGRSAVVTGSSRGIGRTIAIELARRGTNVAICYVSDQSKGKADEVTKELIALGVRAVAIQEDLAVKGVGMRIWQKAMHGLQVSEIDILVNNAALDPPEPLPVHEFDLDDFDRFMQVNTKAPVELVKAMVPHLPASGGRIISISSVLAQRPDVPFAPWAASKAALECLSRYWAQELGATHGLTSNVVAIGPTLTDYHANDPQEVLDELAQLSSAAKRMARPDDVADIVIFLASHAGRWINGDVLQGNGGMVFG